MIHTCSVSPLGTCIVQETPPAHNLKNLRRLKIPNVVADFPAGVKNSHTAEALISPAEAYHPWAATSGIWARFA